MIGNDQILLTVLTMADGDNKYMCLRPNPINIYLK